VRVATGNLRHLSSHVERHRTSRSRQRSPTALKQRQCSLTTSILDKDNNAVQTKEDCRSSGQRRIRIRATIVVITTLWSPANPYLYTVRSTVRDRPRGGCIRHSDRHTGGCLDTDRGFLLNGEHIKLNGVCIITRLAAWELPFPSAYEAARYSSRHGMQCIRTVTIPTQRSSWTCATEGIPRNGEAFDEWKVQRARFATL